MNKQMLKDTTILFVITLVVGFCLAGVYHVTEAPIAAAEAEEKLQSYREVFAEADDFVLAELPEDPGMVSEAMTAVDATGNELGHVFLTTSPNGYGGDIALTVGVTNEGEITSVAVLTMSETAGLGANITKPEFLEQFAGMNVPEVVFTKEGKKAPEEIDAVSGATISTNAVTEAVNAALNCAAEMREGVAP